MRKPVKQYVNVNNKSANQPEHPGQCMFFAAKKELQMFQKTSRQMYVTENYFSHFSTKTFVVGTQKNRLDETVLLGTQNICFNCWVKKK